MGGPYLPVSTWIFTLAKALLPPVSFAGKGTTESAMVWLGGGVKGGGYSGNCNPSADQTRTSMDKLDCYAHRRCRTQRSVGNLLQLSPLRSGLQG